MDLIQDFEFFHGYIDQKESRGILPEAGDYLLRYYFKNSNNSDKRDYVCVLSVAERPSIIGDSGKRIRSIGISSVNGAFTLSGHSEPFPTIRVMIDSFVATKKPVIDQVILIRPVPRQAWALLKNDIDIPQPETILGKGSFGTVLKGKLKKVDLDVAIKRLNEQATEGIFTEALQEARTMRAFEHNNVIRVYGVVIESLPLMLVMELIDGNSLSKVLRGRTLPNGYRMSIVAGLMYGLAFIHDRGYIHRDIAARNVLISMDWQQIKLIDFGLSRLGPTYSIQSYQKIPTKWLSPEVCREGLFSIKSDVWAFAVTCWEIYNDGAEPYPNLKNAEVRAVLLEHDKFDEVRLNLRTCSGEEKPPQGFHECIRLLFEYNHKKRIDSVKMVPVFEQTVFNKLVGMEADMVKAQTQRGQFQPKTPPPAAHPNRMANPRCITPTREAARCVTPTREAARCITPTRGGRTKRSSSAKPTGEKVKTTRRKKG